MSTTRKNPEVLDETEGGDFQQKSLPRGEKPVYPVIWRILGVLKRSEIY